MATTRGARRPSRDSPLPTTPITPMRGISRGSPRRGTVRLISSSSWLGTEFRSRGLFRDQSEHIPTGARGSTPSRPVCPITERRSGASVHIALAPEARCATVFFQRELPALCAGARGGRGGAAPDRAAAAGSAEHLAVLEHHLAAAERRHRPRAQLAARVDAVTCPREQVLVAHGAPLACLPDG